MTTGLGNTGWGTRATVTVRRPTGQSRYGSLDDQEYADQLVPQCVWAPTAAGQQRPEDYGRGETVTETLTLYTLVEADIRSSDKVVLPDGRVFEVIGAARRWRNPFVPMGHGCEVTLQRILG